MLGLDLVVSTVGSRSVRLIDHFVKDNNMQAEKHDRQHELRERLVKAYDQMMDHATSALEHARSDTVPGIKNLLEAARDKTVEMGDLTREEADKVIGYIHRDLEHAAEYMEENRRELSDWLRFDIQLLEQRVAKVFGRMVDHTREILDEFAVRADSAGWKTGEVVGPGTLHCKNCRQVLHFHKTGHIPPCPKCKHTLYEREHEIG
jgi:polyhydroxyalkanoate synthesis regulator phasin